MARQSRHAPSSPYPDHDEFGRVLVGDLQDLVSGLTLGYNHLGEDGKVGAAYDELIESLP